jgi:dsDNA-specific endonuclease/ATPase MutS2
MSQMNIIESEALELLEFYKIKKYVTELCYSNGAKKKLHTFLFFLITKT